MKKSAFISHLACFILLIGSHSFAQASTSVLESLVARAQKSCPRLDCPNSAILVADLTTQDVHFLDSNARAKIQDLAVENARDLWPDTILEGPFQNAERFRLEKVQKLLVNSQLAGYRITYSDQAWDLDTCPDHQTAEQKMQHSNCDEGRIVESAFVDSNLKTVFRDDEAFAEFVTLNQWAARLR